MYHDNNPFGPLSINEVNPLYNPFCNPELPFDDMYQLPWENGYAGVLSASDFYDLSWDYGLERERCKRTYARMIHFLSNSSPVDVYLDGKLFSHALNYGTDTGYIGVRPGHHRLLLYPAGRTINPLFYKTFYIPRRSIVSLVFSGDFPDMDVMAVDDKTTVHSGRAKVKFVHLSPDAPTLDLVSDISVWFSQVMYQESTDYIPVTPGHETLSLRISGTGQILLTMPDVLFSRKKAYTVYTTGMIRGLPPLRLLVTTDGGGKMHAE